MSTAKNLVGYNDSRVMIQGFGWESHQDGRIKAANGTEYEVHWKCQWYDFVKSKVGDLADAKFDLIWLPPPSQGAGAGYQTEQLFQFTNNYGTEEEQRKLLRSLIEQGIEPIADVVVNHRNGFGGWANFKNPDWPSWFICSDDKFWEQKLEDLPNDEDREILRAGKKGGPDFNGLESPSGKGGRELDHANADLREEIKKFLGLLKELGYKGWRFDLVKGYDPHYTAEYNYASKPSFAVGEYWDGDAELVAKWVDDTAWQGQDDPAAHACCAFDFPAQERLKEFINNSQYDQLPSITALEGEGRGFVAINKNKAVTFLENHDTGFPQLENDSFENNEKLMQGYAFILTHPGIPCVYWKHYFDWERGDEIKALIHARKQAGIHSGSFLKTEVHGNSYVAIVGDRAEESSSLIVRIGEEGEFEPGADDWTLTASGEGYAVWVRQ